MRSAEGAIMKSNWQQFTNSLIYHQLPTIKLYRTRQQRDRVIQQMATSHYVCIITTTTTTVINGRLTVGSYSSRLQWRDGARKREDGMEDGVRDGMGGMLTTDRPHGGTHTHTHTHAHTHAHTRNTSN